MNPTAPLSAIPPAPLGRMSLWFALLGGGVAWLLHLLLAYIVSEFGCLTGLGDVRLAGLSAVAWLLIAVTIAALGLAAAATLVSWRGWRRFDHAATRASEGGRANCFSARLGFITNIVFLAVIVVQSVPILYFLHSC